MALDTLLLLAGLGLFIFLVGFGLGILYAERRAAPAANPAAGMVTTPPDTLSPGRGGAPELGFLADDMARAATERWETSRAAAGGAGEASPPTDDELMIFNRVSLGISKLPLFGSHKEYEEAEQGVMASVAERYGLTAEQVAETYRKVHAWKWRHGGEGEPASA